MVSSVGMMRGNSALFWGRVGTLGVGGTLGDVGSTLVSDGGETFEGAEGETDVLVDGEASAKMVAKLRMAVMVSSPNVAKGAAGAGLSSALVSSWAARAELSVEESLGTGQFFGENWTVFATC